MHADLRDAATVRLEAEDSDAFRDLGAQAQAMRGIDWPLVYMHFVTLPDENGRRYQAPNFSPYLAADGSLSWTRPMLEGLLVGDATRSAEVGLFEGDTHSLLLEQPLGGDGVAPGVDE